MRRLESKKDNLIILFLVCIAIMCIIAGCITENKVFAPTLDRETSKLVPEKVESVEAGVERFFLSLENISTSTETLLFYTNHQEVYVYAEEELIYSLERADTIFGRTTGAVWNRVPIPEGTKLLVVEIRQIYTSLAPHEVEYEVGNAITMYQNALSNSVMDVLMSVSIITVGIVLHAYWMFSFVESNKQRDVLYLSLFAIIFGIWSFGETPFATFVYEGRPFASYLAFSCLMTMSLPFVLFVREFLEIENKYLHRIICGYIVVAACLCQFLHLTGIAGVKETVGFTLVSIGLSLWYLLYGVLSCIKHKRSIRKIYANIIGLLALTGTALIDASSYFSNVADSNRYGKIGVLLYIIVLGGESAKTAAAHMKEEHKLEILEQMAVMDMLTGCYNRNAYAGDVEKINSLQGVQIITFDLNNLKKCNDTLGHMAGDNYIKEAAQMIKDTFGMLGKVYRIGGDEFCIITRENSKGTILNKKIELTKKIGHYMIEHPESDFGIACGWAEYEEGLDENIEMLRDRADISMYENKKEIKK